MAKMRSRNNCDKPTRGDKGILPNSFAAIDMLVWWKGLALDPCNPKASSDSCRKFWNQSLKLRKSLFLCDEKCPRVSSQLK